MLDFSAELRERDVTSLKGLPAEANGLEQRVHSQLDRVRVLADHERMMAMDEMSTSIPAQLIATIFFHSRSSPDFWESTSRASRTPMIRTLLIVCGLLALTAIGTSIGLLIAMKLRGRSGR